MPLIVSCRHPGRWLSTLLLVALPLAQDHQVSLVKGSCFTFGIASQSKTLTFSFADSIWYIDSIWLQCNKHQSATSVSVAVWGWLWWLGMCQCALQRPHTKKKQKWRSLCLRRGSTLSGIVHVPGIDLNTVRPTWFKQTEPETSRRQLVGVDAGRCWMSQVVFCQLSN